jgi:hypothetical protein
MSEEQIKAVRRVATAIVETVRESEPLGAPGGILYAALMGHGCTLQQFEGIMGGLVRARMLSKHGDCYRTV